MAEFTPLEAKLIDALATIARWPRSDIGRERDIGEMKACAARTVCDAMQRDEMPTHREVIEILESVGL